MNPMMQRRLAMLRQQQAQRQQGSLQNLGQRQMQQAPARPQPMTYNR
jgi:hypothetical protein